jgi:hypothetical protein
MAATRTKDLQDPVCNKPASVAGVINNYLDRFLTTVAGEAKIKTVGGDFHTAFFKTGFYT